MKNDQLLEPLFADLVHRGLPVDYARRSVDELSDHRADLLAELASEGHATETAEATAMERLGSQRKLARKIAGDFHRRSFAGRWPLITFLLGPPTLLALAWTATLCALVPVAKVLEWFGISGGVADGVMSTGDRIAWHSLWFILMIAVPGLLAVLYTRLVRRSGMHSVWAFPAAVMIGVLAGMPSFSINEEKQQGILMLPIPVTVAECNESYTTFAKWYFEYFTRSPQQVFQLLTPICLGIAMLAWGTWERKRTMRLEGGATGAGSMQSIAA